MAIKYITFKSPISIGGKWTTITEWSREKHGVECEATERGDFVFLTTKDGTTRKIPISNVGYIHLDADKPAIHLDADKPAAVTTKAKV